MAWTPPPLKFQRHRQLINDKMLKYQDRQKLSAWQTFSKLASSAYKVSPDWICMVTSRFILIFYVASSQKSHIIIFNNPIHYGPFLCKYSSFYSFFTKYGQNSKIFRFLTTGQITKVLHNTI